MSDLRAVIKKFIFNKLLSFLKNYFVPVLGFMAIVVLLLLFILPVSQKIKKVENKNINVQREIDSVKNEIVATKAEITKKISQQKRLSTLLEELQDNIQSIQKSISQAGTYSLPSPSPYKEPLISLPDKLKQMAQRQGLKKITVSLGEKSEKGANSILRADISATAEIPKLRKYIVNMLEIPFVQDIRQVHIQQYLDAALLQLSINLLVS